MQDFTVLYVAAAISASLLCAACYLAFRLTRRDFPSDRQASPSATLSFRPMERLLRESDFQFLAAQPGYHPQIGRQLRAHRVRIMRKYVDQVSVEFRRLHLSLRLLTLHAGHDNPEIARELLLQRILFHRRMVEVRIRLALFGFGLEPIHVGGLVRMVDQLRSHVDSLSRSALAPGLPASVRISG